MKLPGHNAEIFLEAQPTTLLTKLAELRAAGIIMAIAGHLSRRMLERYSHIRMKAKRAATGMVRTEFLASVGLQSLRKSLRRPRALPAVLRKLLAANDRARSSVG